MNELRKWREMKKINRDHRLPNKGFVTGLAFQSRRYRKRRLSKQSILRWQKTGNVHVYVYVMTVSLKSSSCLSVCKATKKVKRYVYTASVTWLAVDSIRWHKPWRIELMLKMSVWNIFECRTRRMGVKVAQGVDNASLRNVEAKGHCNPTKIYYGSSAFFKYSNSQIYIAIVFRKCILL